MLQPRVGESLPHAGCGTGYLTRSLGKAIYGLVTGANVDPDWLDYARRRDTCGASYQAADARHLPFADGSFNLVVSVTAVGLIREEE